MRLPVLLTIVLGGQCARADLIETVRFTLTAPTTGSAQQTVLVPQFDPAKGALNSVTLTVSENFQYVLELFNTGAGTFSATVLDQFTFTGIALPSEAIISGAIPPAEPVFNYQAPPVASGPLTEMFGANTANFFTGTGSVPFDITLAPPVITQFSGSSTSSALVFGGVAGAVTADFAFTPATSPVPEPSAFGLAGLGVAASGLLAMRRLRPCACLRRLPALPRQIFL